MPKNRFFLIGLVDDSGAFQGVHSFSTDKGSNAGFQEHITVSKEIWDIILSFDRQINNTSKMKPLHEFLNTEKSEAHWLEKLEFYQKRIRNGKPFNDNIVFSKMIPEPTMNKLPRSCDCSVLSLNQTTDPGGTYTDVSTGNRYYSTDQIVDEEDENEDGYKERAEHWASGASKWKYFQSSGWKTNCGTTYSNNINGLNNEAQEPGRFRNRSYISIRLTCNNGNELPENCNCNKRLYYNYDYLSQIKVKSEVLNGDAWCPGKKKAAAAAQDVAIVYYTKHNELEPTGSDYGAIEEGRIIDVLDHALVATCESPVPDTSFWSTLGEAADGVYEQILTIAEIAASDVDNASDPGNIFDLLGELSPSTILEAIGEVGSAFRYINANCSSTLINSQVMAGGKYMELEPNETVRFWITSNASVGTEGRRGWLARAENLSAFAHTLVVNPGIDLEEGGCCTPWVGNYSGATFEAIRTNFTNRAIMGDHLHLFGLSDCIRDVDGVALSRGDFGSCERKSDVRECDENNIITAEHTGYQIGPLQEEEEENGVMVRVYDLQGQLLLQSNICADCNVVQLIEEQLRRTNNTGMYIVNYVDDKGRQLKSDKLVILPR